MNGAYISPISGSTTTRVVAGVSGPVEWSHSGAQIAYSTGTVIHKVNTDGSGDTALSTPPGGDGDIAPAWENGDSKILFARINPNGGTPFGYIYEMNSDGTSQTQLFGNGSSLFSAPKMDPANSSVISFEGNPNGSPTSPFQIFTCNPSNCSGTATALTNFSTLKQSADDNWSPDGSYLVISGLDVSNNLNVWKVTYPGAALTQLTSYSCPNEAGDPSISPDSLHLAFEFDAGLSGSCVYQNNNAVPTFVYAASANGSSPASIGQNCNNIGCSPRWKPF